MEDNNLRLTNIFTIVGANYNYKNVQAEFKPFADVKVKWQRTYECANFHVSDYLMDAPDNILSALAQSLFEKITGAEGDLSEEFKGYVSAMDFTKAHRDEYLARNDAHITDKYDGLIQSIIEGEGGKLEGIVVATNEEVDRPRCSILMRTLILPSFFEDAPDYVLDFELKHYLTIFEGGYRPSEDTISRAVSMDNKHPNVKQAREWLREHDIYL